MTRSNHPLESSPSPPSKIHHFPVCLCMFLLLNFLSNAVSQSIVRYLPGFDGPLPFELETGYVSVDDSNGVELFYYFVKSENNPREDPLVLWMTGGPGCSGLSGLAFEIGPFSVNKVVYNGSLPTLVLNPYSWTKVSNIIFIDSPVSTGFSYAKSLRGSYSSDTKSVDHTNIFIAKWLEKHPEFLTNPFYMGGDSYSGITVPMIVQEISDGIAAGHKPCINIKGYFLGNPVTTRDIADTLNVSFSHGMGLISDELFQSTKKNCGGEYVSVDPNNVQCIKDLQAISALTSNLYPGHILEPYCDSGNPKFKRTNKDRSLFEEEPRNNIDISPTDEGFECRTYSYMLLYHWANDGRVQKALNIRKGTIKEWLRCNLHNPRYFQNVNNTIIYHENLSRRNYHSLIYSFCHLDTGVIFLVGHDEFGLRLGSNYEFRSADLNRGDHDLVVPFLSTQSWIKSLNLAIHDDWHPWYVHGRIAGYTRTYMNNMTYATIKGGGHTAPEYKPKECLAMFKRWISYESL